MAAHFFIRDFREVVPFLLIIGTKLQIFRVASKGR